MWKEVNIKPKNTNEKCFENWKKRQFMCVASNEDYFEGDKINMDSLLIICLLLNEQSNYFIIHI